MSRSSKSKRRRKKLRRDRNRRGRDDLMRSEDHHVRPRTSFSGKARSGDEAQVALEFSETSVPFDPTSSEFSSESARRHEAVEIWNESGNPTSGNA